MKITASTISLNVDDVRASSVFLAEHFGFSERMASDGFASLHRDAVTPDIVFLQRGIPQLPEDFRDQHTSGVIIAFTVEDILGEEARLRERGVAITLPLREEPWGEKLFQVTDPNGVLIQLVEWAAPVH